MDSVLTVLSWTIAVVVILFGYNHETIVKFFTFSLVPVSEQKDSAEPLISGTDAPEDPAKNDATRQHMAVQNWMLYVHLLISAPAIAMVLHVTQQWTEYHMIINTTLVLSTIFAVDAFSVEMANFWVHRTKKHHASKADAPSPKESARIMQEMHTRLGLIRLFAWVINAVMLLLLFTLAYPVEVEQQRTNSGIFVVVVVAFAGVFLAPDLVREFTDTVSFNSIQYRLYGDFIIRALVLFFVWRASVAEHWP
jgi:hypothetical protein